MNLEELDILYQWSKEENWDPSMKDLDSYFKSDPDGFFIGTLNEKPICVVSIVHYDNHFAFVGNYIVAKEYRHKGFGIELTNKAMLPRMQNRIAALDAVLDQIETYKKIGFLTDSFHTRHEGIARKVDINNEHLVNLKNVTFDKIYEYDFKHFLATRAQFLNEWLNSSNAESIGYLKNNLLEGYAVMRKIESGYRIAPLFANNIEIARKILQYLINKIDGNPFTINIPDANKETQKIIHDFKLKPLFQTMRMYRNGKLELPYHNIYSTTSFELG